MKKTAHHDAVDSLPVLALQAPAMTGFICILTETTPAGLLPGISASLNISPSVGGQMVTAYAASLLLSAVPLSIMTRPGRCRCFPLGVTYFVNRGPDYCFQSKKSGHLSSQPRGVNLINPFLVTG